ncbi:MAG: hypothetical protein K0Q87_3128 [Neobacillus sp.]|jgi:uncharacterized protein (TIGR02413 family)|nr:hypothetical protein [Neobacillus sp.]
MTLNILFLSIKINKRKITLDEALHEEKVEKIYEAQRERGSFHPFV